MKKNSPTENRDIDAGSLGIDRGAIVPVVPIEDALVPRISSAKIRSGRSGFLQLMAAFLIGLPLLLTACTSESHDIAKKQLEARRGEPTLFYIDDAPYSVRRFREEIMYDRLMHEGRADVPTPDEMESLLNKYILDTILLQKALSEVSTGSSDFRQYMWKYLREGLIKYYLDKRSGRLDAIQSYRSAVESGGITEQDLKSVPDLKKLNDEDPVLAVRMLAAVKLRRRLAAAARMQQVEIGKIKSEVKVKIVGGALYANPE